MRQPRALLLLLSAFLTAFVVTLGHAQRAVDGAVFSGVTYLEARSLALVLGDVVTVVDDTLTWRGQEGVATFFAGSAVALLQRPGDGGPTEWPLSAPVRSVDAAVPGGEDWYLPLDAAQLLGVAAEEVGGVVTLHTPSGDRLDIVLPAAREVRPGVRERSEGIDAGAGWEVAQLGAATGVRLFAGDQSLLLLDLDMLPLAFPEATAVIDDAALRAGSDNALLLIGTALAEGQISTSVAFEQDGRRLEVEAPYRVHVYQGDPAAVGPGNEVAAVVLLPATFSLYRPVAVTWSGVEATVTFRR